MYLKITILVYILLPLPWLAVCLIAIGMVTACSIAIGMVTACSIVIDIVLLSLLPWRRWSLNLLTLVESHELSSPESGQCLPHKT